MSSSSKTWPQITQISQITKMFCEVLFLYLGVHAGEGFSVLAKAGTHMFLNKGLSGEEPVCLKIFLRSSFHDFWGELGAGRLFVETDLFKIVAYILFIK